MQKFSCQKSLGSYGNDSRGFPGVTVSHTTKCRQNEGENKVSQCPSASRLRAAIIWVRRTSNIAAFQARPAGAVWAWLSQDKSNLCDSSKMRITVRGLSANAYSRRPPSNVGQRRTIGREPRTSIGVGTGRLAVEDRAPTGADRPEEAFLGERSVLAEDIELFTTLGLAGIDPLDGRIATPLHSAGDPPTPTSIRVERSRPLNSPCASP